MNRRHIRRSSYNSGVMRSTKKQEPVRSVRQSGASEAGGGHYNYITGAGADETRLESTAVNKYSRSILHQSRASLYFTNNVFLPLRCLGRFKKAFTTVFNIYCLLHSFTRGFSGFPSNVRSSRDLSIVPCNNLALR